MRTVHAHHKLALISIGGSDNPDWTPLSASDSELGPVQSGNG